MTSGVSCATPGGRGPLQISRIGPDPQYRRDPVTNLFRIDRGVVANNDFRFLEPPQPVRHRRRGESDAATKLAPSQPGIGLKLLDDLPVDNVHDNLFSSRHPDTHTVPRYYRPNTLDMLFPGLARQVTL